MRACDWKVEKEGRLRTLKMSTDSPERERNGMRGGDKIEPIREEEEPESQS